MNLENWVSAENSNTTSIHFTRKRGFDRAFGEHKVRFAYTQTLTSTYAAVSGITACVE